jgi:hypothetical protein
MSPDKNDLTGNELGHTSVRLDHLFQAYRAATEYEGPGPHFMPELWKRIESRRSNSMLLERVARIFATGAVALAVMAAIVVSFAPQGPLEDSWVENIANHQLEQQAVYFEPVRLSSAVDQR